MKPIELDQLETELLHLLKTLYPFDRDLHSLVICLNPNHIYGSDQELSLIVLDLLNTLQTLRIVKKEKIQVKRYDTKKKNSLDIYSLVDQPKNVSKT